MQNYNLQKNIKQNIQDAEIRTAQPGYGIVMEFDPDDNSATVLMAHPGSDMPGQFYRKVPCPTSLGVQTVAPEVGRPCWVVFRDGTESHPVITHYFNHSFEELDYERHYSAKNAVPRFMLEL